MNILENIIIETRCNEENNPHFLLKENKINVEFTIKLKNGSRAYTISRTYDLKDFY